MRQRSTRMSCTGNNYASRTDIYRAIFKDGSPSFRHNVDEAIKASKAAGVWGMASGWTPEQLALCMAFQDAAGTIPVYAGGQTFGLVLDGRYKPGTRGPELVVITSVTGVPIGGGILTMYSTGATISAGKCYELVMDVAGYSGSSTVGFNSNALFNNVSNYTVENGKCRQAGVAVSSGTLQIFNRSTNTANFSNISAREIPGVHLTQSNTMEQPTIGADLLQSIFDGTDDNQIAATGGGATAGFFFCAGIQVGKITGIQRLFDDRNATGGFCARISDAKFGLTTPSTPGYVAETGSELSVSQKVVLTAWQTGSTLNVQINSGTVASVACPAVLPGTAQITFGKTNNAASDYFKGGIFERVYRTGVPLTDSEREAVKRRVAKSTGVTL